MTTHQNAAGPIQVGALVVTRDGVQLGTVKELRGNAFKVVAPGRRDYWLGTDSIQTWDGQQVVLGFDEARLDDYRVESPGDSAMAPAQPSDTDYAMRQTGVAGEPQPARDAEAERSMRLREERLSAEKRPVEAGEVGLRKEVITEEKEIVVPVQREEVVIERLPGSGQVTDEQIGEGESIRIPVMEEEVRVTKDTVVTGEVAVGKRTVQDTRRVSDTVRREEARVETEGDVQAVQGGGGQERFRDQDHGQAGVR